MISVGVEVEPENPINFNRRLKIGFEYKVNMADIVIMVSDHDEDPELSSVTPPTHNSSAQDDSLSGSASENLRDPDGAITASSVSPSISGSRSNRPSCHRSRGEGQRSQLQLLETRSNIPLITGAGFTLQPCSYYRQKLQVEDPSYWVNIGSLQKTAGEKVVRKINDQHRSLAAAEAEQQRKRTNSSFGSLLFSNSNEADNIELSKQKNFVQMKRRPMKLEPLYLKHKITT